MRFKLSPRVINQFSYYSTSESIGLYNNRSLNVCLFGHHQSGKTVLCSTITKLLSKVNSTRPVPINLLDSNEDEKKLGNNLIDCNPNYCHNNLMTLNFQSFPRINN